MLDLIDASKINFNLMKLILPLIDARETNITHNGSVRNLNYPYLTLLLLKISLIDAGKINFRHN